MKQHITCMWSILYTHIVPNKQVDTHSNVTIMVTVPIYQNEQGYMQN